MVVLIAIIAGTTLAHKSSAASPSSKSKSKSVVQQTDPNDPSTFVKDPALKQSFWGMAYTPEGSQLPGCGNNLCASRRWGEARG